MSYIRAVILLSVVLFFISGGASGLTAEDNLNYFRRDGGVSNLEADSLPEHLGSPEGFAGGRTWTPGIPHR